MKPPTGKAVKCVRDISHFSPDAYRLPADGRKWFHKCVQRQRIAIHLAISANPDGSSVTLGVAALVRELKIPATIVALRLDELKQLGFIVNTGWDPKTHVRVRRLNLDALKTPELSEEQDSRIGDGRLPDSPARLPDSPARLPDSPDKTPGLVVEDSRIEGQDSRIEDSRIRVKAVDTVASTENPDPDRFTVHPPTPTGLPGKSGVSALIEEATIAEYDWAMTKTIRQDMEKLEQQHGREKFLAAGRSFIKDPPRAVNAKTEFGWNYFINGFEGFAARQIVTDREADLELQTKVERETTNRFWDAKWPVERLDAEFIETLSAADLEYIAKVKAASTVNDLPEDAPARSITLGKLNIEFSVQRREKREREERAQAEDLFK